MKLSWEEIQARAITFSKKWETAHREEAEAQSFQRDFFKVFGIEDLLSCGVFEYKVPLEDNHNGYIDYLFPQKIAVEMKSSKKDLKKAFEQLQNYVIHLKSDEIPSLLMVCDFENIILYKRTSGEKVSFKTKDLRKYVKHFADIAGYETTRTYDNQQGVDVKAASKMADLHNAMESIGYEGHSLEVYLVRLLFCLFADDTGIFPKGSFQNYVENSSEDGSDLSARLERLFEVLNMPIDIRKKKALLKQDLLQFQYINGGLFKEKLDFADFDAKMRATLLKSCSFDWNNISPAIFGSMFQGVMNEKERHDLGAHYTSEENILKVINPLFMDDLYAEFERVKASPLQLDQFHNKLASLKFLDPACGCGNFLIIAYRELRKLELEVLKMKIGTRQRIIDISPYVKVNVGQFYGIEIEEFPCQVAQVGMWLIDHQMNMKVSEQFGLYFARLPLRQSASIVNANALRMDWNEVVPSSELSYIFGNPPFLGGKIMNKEQKQEILNIVGKVNRSASIDYVVAWYYKAAEYIQNTKIKVAFVSTNSICQGAQIEPIWKKLIQLYNIKINFAYRTFIWNNEAANKAKVHCIIVGFSLYNDAMCKIYNENDVILCKKVSPYLIESENIFVSNRSKPICNVPEIDYGNMPNDGGYFIFTQEQKDNFLREEPQSECFFKIFQSGEDYIHGKLRYCLWLPDITSSDLKNSPKVRERINLVKETRLKSTALPTREKAKTPHKFFYISHPSSNYLLIPRTSSEKREYIPIGFVSPDIIASDASSIIANANLYLFGIITSKVHMAWMKLVAGRLKSDFRYSGGMVYNNFPWIEDISDTQRKRIEQYAQAVLDARANHPNETLAGMYGDIMPDDLRKAHNNLDREVLKLYGYSKDATEDEIVADLLNRYQKLVGE